MVLDRTRRRGRRILALPACAAPPGAGTGARRPHRCRTLERARLGPLRARTQRLRGDAVTACGLPVDFRDAALLRPAANEGSLAGMSAAGDRLLLRHGDRQPLLA